MFDIGILGGMGPLACSKLFEFIVKNTFAQNDQEHPKIIILNDTKIPDRTKYILDKTQKNPLHDIAHNINLLASLNTSVIGVSCNTSYFYIKKENMPKNIKLLNMPELVLEYCSKMGFDNIFILSTIGTKVSKIYENKKIFKNKIIYPDETTSNVIHQKIYEIKKSANPNYKNVINELITIIETMFKNNNASRDSTAIILGCTELSLLTDELRDKSRFIFVDPLEILGLSLIKKSGYKYKINDFYNFEIIDSLSK